MMFFVYLLMFSYVTAWLPVPYQSFSKHKGHSCLGFRPRAKKLSSSAQQPPNVTALRLCRALPGASRAQHWTASKQRSSTAHIGRSLGGR